MRILWITNILFEHHLTMVGKNAYTGTSGSWLHAAYAASVNNPNLQLHIATSSTNSELLVSEHDGNLFYIAPGGDSRGYNINSKDNLYQWQKIRELSNPDAVIVWGTECRFSYLAMKAMKGLPIAIYMQGVIESIYDHYFEGIPQKYRIATLRDIIDKYNKNSSYRTFQSQVCLEREMLKMASSVIVENDWCEDMCKSINPKLKIYRNKLPIRNVFLSRKWSLDEIERHSIFTNAGGYPIKGHHILFQALGLVKKSIPDFKCYIPGPKLETYNNIKRKTGYIKFLNDLINSFQLKDNIIYTGNLSPEKMVDHIATCNVYVMPSVMENHSASLIEAMMVGAPSISSLVGGTASLIQHKKNAIIYNSLDVRSLAGNIIRILTDDDLAIKLSENAFKMRIIRDNDFGDEMNIIYNHIIEL